MALSRPKICSAQEGWTLSTVIIGTMGSIDLIGQRSIMMAEIRTSIHRPQGVGEICLMGQLLRGRIGSKMILELRRLVGREAHLIRGQRENQKVGRRNLRGKEMVKMPLFETYG